jgi:hypothetical protein
MNKVTFLIIGIIGLAVVIAVHVSRKHTIESVVMPGRLAEGHAKYENQCTQCHSAFKKESQNDLCLACHKEVAQDIKVRQGFHGHTDAIENKQCKVCHTDHKGRAFDMVRLDKETFKHELTDFPLTGAHSRLSLTCSACHATGKKFREAPKDCFTCHEKHDRHKGQLGKNCADCHNGAVWKATYFDHAKTPFPLTGKHQKVACNACHANESYKNTPVVCVACHLINDIHDSPRDEKCERCHSSEGWKTIAYDHNSLTKFPLKGKHVQTTCAACHINKVFTIKTGMQCIDCHKADDGHKGKNGTRCERCHTETEWKQVSFDHNRDSKFKLSGAHTKAKCDACHKAASSDMKTDASCSSCHQAEDVHKGQEGTNCQSCHTDKGWREEVKFDHDLARFPLIGQHAVLACGECHQSLAYKDARMECNSCHAKDDFHKRTLGTDCAQCHNPNGWKLWQFDHDTQTKYKLEGPHAGIKCQACHKDPMGKDVKSSSGCIACHEQDDVHKGQFGEFCEQCHAVDSFKKYSIGRKG